MKVLDLEGTGGRLLREIKEELSNEAVLLNKITSPHVVFLHGVVFKDPNFAIVMEYAAPDLSFFLNDIEPESLSWGQRFCLAKQIALGMAAVHKSKVFFLSPFFLLFVSVCCLKVVHHDLRAANVLLGSKPRFCRLTDFGLSKAKATSSRNSKSKTGNIVWLAPEYQANADSELRKKGFVSFMFSYDEETDTQRRVTFLASG